MKNMVKHVKDCKSLTILGYQWDRYRNMITKIHRCKIPLTASACWSLVLALLTQLNPELS